MSCGQRVEFKSHLCAVLLMNPGQAPSFTLQLKPDFPIMKWRTQCPFYRIVGKNRWDNDVQGPDPQ